MSLTEKVAFIKGLVEGSELNLGTKEQKIFDSLLEIVSDIATAVTEIDEDLSTLYDDVDELYDEVEALGDDVDAIFEEDDECDCGHHHGAHDDAFMYEVKCDKCGEVICIDEETLLGGDIECPNCGEPLELEFECDDCDCGCDHDHE